MPTAPTASNSIDSMTATVEQLADAAETWVRFGVAPTLPSRLVEAVHRLAAATRGAGAGDDPTGVLPRRLSIGELAMWLMRPGETVETSTLADRMSAMGRPVKFNALNVALARAVQREHLERVRPGQYRLPPMPRTQEPTGHEAAHPPPVEPAENRRRSHAEAVLVEPMDATM